MAGAGPPDEALSYYAPAGRESGGRCFAYDWAVWWPVGAGDRLRCCARVALTTVLPNLKP